MAASAGIGLVAFDLGGVLANVEKNLDDAFFVQKDFEAFTCGIIDSDDFFFRVSKRLNRPMRELESQFRDMLTTVSHTETVVSRLKVSYTFWSNINVCHFEHILHQAPFLERHDALARGLSFELKDKKPSRSFFKKCIEKAAHPANRILFLDDCKKNVAVAKGLGVNAHLVGDQRDVISILKGLSLLE
jgi:hypothetical protein